MYLPRSRSSCVFCWKFFPRVRQIRHLWQFAQPMEVELMMETFHALQFKNSPKSSSCQHFLLEHFFSEGNKDSFINLPNGLKLIAVGNFPELLEKAEVLGFASALLGRSRSVSFSHHCKLGKTLPSLPLQQHPQLLDHPTQERQEKLNLTTPAGNLTKRRRRFQLLTTPFETIRSHLGLSFLLQTLLWPARFGPARHQPKANWHQLADCAFPWDILKRHCGTRAAWQ